MQTAHEYTDIELFSLIADGDEAAFEELVVRYGPQVKPAIREVIKDTTQVSDLVQDVFLHLWLGREKLRDIQQPRAWIFRIAYYQSYAWLRQKKVRELANSPIADDANISSAEVSAEEWASFHQTRSWLQEAIRLLPPQTYKIYMLSREEGLKINEIANQLNISPQTVKNTLHRGIKSIRDFLAEKGVWLPAILFFYRDL